MRLVPLKGSMALVDDVDFARVSAHRWCLHRTRGLSYAKTTIEGKTVYLHRFILNAEPGTKVDHRDRDGLNCRRENLRVCSNGQNTMNQRKRRGATSRYKGVSLSKSRGDWRANVILSGASKHLGYFASEVEAALAYDEAARQHFGEFALTNFPPKKPCGNQSPALYSLPEENVF